MLQVYFLVQAITYPFLAGACLPVTDCAAAAGPRPPVNSWMFSSTRSVLSRIYGPVSLPVLNPHDRKRALCPHHPCVFTDREHGPRSQVVWTEHPRRPRAVNTTRSVCAPLQIGSGVVRETSGGSTTIESLGSVRFAVFSDVHAAFHCKPRPRPKRRKRGHIPVSLSVRVRFEQPGSSVRSVRLLSTLQRWVHDH